jgi:hypothetical protein
MTEPAAPTPSASVPQILETASQLFRLTLPKCLALSMVAVLVVEIPNLYWLSKGHGLDFHGWLWPSDPTYLGLSVLCAAVTLYLFSAVMLQQRSLAEGVLCGSGAALRAALRRLPLLLASWVLAQLSLAVGLSLLLLPGLFLFVCYLLMLPVVLFEHPNPYMVLVRCVVLVRPHWWKTLAATVIAALVVLVCVLAFAAILSIVAVMASGTAFQAIAAACFVAFFAAAGVFLSALLLTLHSAASYSAAANSSA